MGNVCDVEVLERVAVACWGELGAFSYRAFRWANAALFGGGLAPTFIQWAITPHGACLGHTRVAQAGGNPVVTLHPSIWGDGAENAHGLREAWGGIPACRLYTLDVIVHELMHVSVGGWTVGKSSHDNARWAAEVERMSPLLGLGEVTAAPTKRARRDGIMARVPSKAGAMTMMQLATWPYSMRPADWYEHDGELPAELDAHEV